LAGLVVVLLISCLAQFAGAQTVTRGKTYAVFVAAFNSQTGQARGGVAGTAFFLSPQSAVTAFHVLQPKSFRPSAGFDRIQVWLVHEDQPAIELKLGNIAADADQDFTAITLDRGQRVAQEFVFTAAASRASVGERVETEGFLANSVGPIIHQEGSRLAIVAVPTLQRSQAFGELIRKSAVDLRSLDVNLKGAACLQLSYRPIVGLSGGPVISANGNVIGMNSFAEPNGRQQTWAVAMKAI